MFRFTIRDVLWLTVVVATLVAWYVQWAEARNLSEELDARPLPVLVEGEGGLLPLKPGQKMDVAMSPTGKVTVRYVP